jgi:hypothetical protein
MAYGGWHMKASIIAWQASNGINNGEKMKRKASAVISENISWL